MEIFMDMLKVVVDFIFGAGLFVNALLFIPQIIKLYKTKDSKDLSKITFVGFCLTQASAIVYGYFHQDKILMIGYAFSLIMCGTVTLLSFMYSKGR
jgi:MtN3 and saliva related transmembrane protein